MPQPPFAHALSQKDHDFASICIELKRLVKCLGEAHDTELALARCKHGDLSNKNDDAGGIDDDNIPHSMDSEPRQHMTNERPSDSAIIKSTPSKNTYVPNDLTQSTGAYALTPPPEESTELLGVRELQSGSQTSELREPRGSSKSSASSGCSNMSFIERTASVMVQQGTKNKDEQTILMNIIGAVGLRDADHFIGQGASDPYCVFEVVGKPESRVETPIINDNCNPMWNYEFTTKHVRPEDTLVFNVWDKDPNYVKNDDHLGRAFLGADELFSGGGFYGSLTLSDDSLKDQGSLMVKAVIPRLAAEVNAEEEAAVKKLILESRKHWPEITLTEEHRTSSRNSLDSLSNPSSRRTLIPDKAHLHGSALVTTSFLRMLVIHPFSAKRGLFDMLGLLSIGYDFFMIPFVAAFNVKQSSELDVFGFVVTCFWFADMVLNFFTGFHQGGLIEMRPRRIAKHYLQTWFLMDFFLLSLDVVYIFVSVIDLSTGGQQSGSYAGILRVFRSARTVRTVRLVTLVRLSKLAGGMSAIFTSVKNESSRMVLRILTMFGAVMALAHLVSCGWYALGSIKKHERHTWVEDKNMERKYPLWRYIAAMQWSFAQFTPSPTDIQPKNDGERLYQLLTNFLGLFVFSSFVSTITGHLAAIRKQNAERTQQQANLRRFFSEKQVSLQLSKCITDYSRYHFKEQKESIKEKDIPIFEQLPLDLLAQLHLEMHLPVLTPHPFFQLLAELDVECFKKLCHKGAKEDHVRPNGEVFPPGVASSAMYFIGMGDFNYHRASDIQHLRARQWICEPALWIQSWIHRGRLVSTTRSEIVSLSVQIWSAIVSSSPPHSTRIRFMRHYAMQFVRQGADMGDCDDIWAPGHILQTFSESAHEYATSGYFSNKLRTSMAARLSLQRASRSMANLGWGKATPE